MGDDLLTSMSMLNSSIQNASNAYLTSKASKDDRKFAESMYQRQVEDARANWMMQNEYNSPVAQRDRMIAAQINPAIAWSKGLSADTGNSSEPDMATPLSWNKRIPAGLSQINPFEQLAAVLNAEKVKAEVKKMGADTRNIDQSTINLQLDEALKTFDVAKEKARSVYYGRDAYNDIMKKINENEILCNTAANLLKQGKLTEAEEACQNALEDWYKIQKQYKEVQLPFAAQEIMSVIANNRSNANLNNARATTENTMRPLYRVSQILRNGLDSYEFKEKSDLYQDKVNALLYEYRNSPQITDAEVQEIQSAADIARKNNDWYHWNQFLNTVEKINDGANKWAPWAFSRTDDKTHEETVTHYDARGRKTSSTNISRRDYYRGRGR